MLKTTLMAFTASTLLTAAPGFAKTFEQAPLPYDTDALAPVIDQQTMDIHYNRHHAGYVKKLNQAVADNAELQDMELQDIVENVSNYSDAVRNNAGGHYNHSLFWQVMAPVGDGGEPSPALQQAIQQAFGSQQQLQSAFNEQAATRFGSGWAWLIVDDQGKLQVTSTANQDNPLMDVVEQQGTPILGLDVWEHAYYLKYQNKRGDYAQAWWKLVNWQEVSKRYQQATM